MKNIFNSLTGSFFRTIGRILAYLLIGLAVAYFTGFINIANVNAESINYEYYEIRSGSYNGSIMATSQNSTKNIYICQNNSYCIMTMSFFLDTEINYNSQQILTTLDVCSGVDNFPRFYDSSNNGSVKDGYLVSSENVGTCTLYGQTVLRQRIKIAWSPSYDFSTLGYTNVYLNSLWSSYNNVGSEVAFQILSVNNEIYTAEMQAQDKENQQNQTIIDQNNQQLEEQEETNEKLDELNDNITSTEGPELDALENTAGWLPPGPIDSILNLPLTYLNSLTTSLGETCNPITLTLPFIDETFNLPCLSSVYAEIDGLNVWINTIGVIASAIILFSYFMKLYKWVDDTLTFRENNYIDNWGGV